MTNDGLTRIPINNVILDDLPEAEDFSKNDPFYAKWDDIKGYAGIDNNFKRRTIRNLAKAEMSDAYMDSAGAVVLAKQSFDKWGSDE